MAEHRIDRQVEDSAEILEERESSNNVRKRRNAINEAVKSLIERDNTLYVVTKNGDEIEILSDPSDAFILDNYGPEEKIPTDLKDLKDVSDDEYYRTREYVAFNLRRFSFSKNPCNQLHLNWQGNIKGEEVLDIYGRSIRTRANTMIFAGDFILGAAKVYGIVPSKKTSLSRTEAMETLRVLKLIGGIASEEEINMYHKYKGPKISKKQTEEGGHDEVSPKDPNGDTEPSFDIPDHNHDGPQEPPQNDESDDPENSSPNTLIVTGVESRKEVEAAFAEAADKTIGLINEIERMDERGANAKIPDLWEAYFDLYEKYQAALQAGVPINERKLKAIKKKLDYYLAKGKEIEGDQMDEIIKDPTKPDREKNKADGKTDSTQKGPAAGKKELSSSDGSSDKPKLKTTGLTGIWTANPKVQTGEQHIEKLLRKYPEGTVGRWRVKRLLEMRGHSLDAQATPDIQLKFDEMKAKHDALEAEKQAKTKEKAAAENPEKKAKKAA